MKNQLRNVMSGYMNQITYDADKRKTSVGVVNVLSQLETARRDVTTENCIYQLGDIRCNLTLVKEYGIITNFIAAENVVDVKLSSNILLADTRYIAGFFLPLSGLNVGVMNDIINVVITSPQVIKLTFGEVYPSVLAPFTTFFMTIGCTKTLAACVDNDNLPKHRGFPFVPGSKSFTSGSGLVDP
jgi:hypothetical protein